MLFSKAYESQRTFPGVVYLCETSKATVHLSENSWGHLDLRIINGALQPASEIQNEWVCAYNFSGKLFWWQFWQELTRQPIKDAVAQGSSHGRCWSHWRPFDGQSEYQSTGQGQLHSPVPGYPIGELWSCSMLDWRRRRCQSWRGNLWRSCSFGDRKTKDINNLESDWQECRLEQIRFWW